MRLVSLNRLFALLSLLSLVCPAGANVPDDAQLLDGIAAIVNEDVITAREVDRQMQLIIGQLQARNQGLPPKDMLRTQVLERLILQRLQLQMAARNRIDVADEAVNRAILNFAQQNNMSLSQFREALQSEGFAFADYRQNIREEMIISRLRQRVVVSQVSVSNQEVDELLAGEASRGGTEYRIGHILLALPEGADNDKITSVRDKARGLIGRLREGADFAQLAISNSDGQQALEGGDLGWRSPAQVPSLFAGIITGMKTGDVSDAIRSPSGFHIIKLLEQRSNEERVIVDQSLARHILIRPHQALSDSEARARLEQLLQRIRQGESFAELARSHSDDPVSASQGGSLGWVSPGMMVPEFEEVMVSTQPGKVSEPFRSPYGWHIIKVEDRRRQDVTEENRRERARQAIHMRKVEEQGELWLRRLRDEAYVELR